MLKKYEMVFISPIGPIGINSRNEKVSELKFNTNLKKIESKNIFLREVCRQLELYFKKKLHVFDIPYTIIGTNYQVRILKEVAKISYGKQKLTLI
jgi:methylated-DNA-[protein]-cysteine S-methyltransferase